MHDYEGITLDQVNALAQRTAEQGFTDPESLDIYRGRQVWIGHGNDVVTRYCHLESIEPSIDVGIVVRQGDAIAHIGESGTPESITAPGTEVHLHAEVRIGDSFLGSGLSEGEVRILYERLFSPE
jgi:murein DD-endopeptidase MepM/ murein hydrolase activator NlpD